MQAYYVITVLIVITTILTFINHKLLKWPVTIAVTVLSLLISGAIIFFKNSIPEVNSFIAENVTEIHFDEIVMHILLGFLLFGAAFHTNAKEFFSHIKPIGFMAIISTLISTFTIAGLIYLAFIVLHYEIPFIECLLFGALISPTDPIAALGILKKLGIPRSIEMQITGESLINDGIAIVIFTTVSTFALNPATQQGAGDIALLFLHEAGGGLLYGAILGVAGYYLLKLTTDPPTEILITLSLVMGGYAVGEMLGVSSPLSMVVAGLICSVADKTDAKTHISEEIVFHFWELIEEFINVVLFLLIGIGVFIIPFNGSIILVGFICILLLLIARYLSLLPVFGLLGSSFPKNSIYLFTWGGLRGAISIALALTIPPALHREEFLSITYIIAVFSIIVQGLTTKQLAMKLGLNKQTSGIVNTPNF